MKLNITQKLQKHRGLLIRKISKPVLLLFLPSPIPIHSCSFYTEISWYFESYRCVVLNWTTYRWYYMVKLCSNSRDSLSHSLSLSLTLSLYLFLSLSLSLSIYLSLSLSNCHTLSIPQFSLLSFNSPSLSLILSIYLAIYLQGV